MTLHLDSVNVKLYGDSSVLAGDCVGALSADERNHKGTLQWERLAAVRPAAEIVSVRV